MRKLLSALIRTVFTCPIFFYFFENKGGGLIFAQCLFQVRFATKSKEPSAGLERGKIIGKGVKNKTLLTLFNNCIAV